MTEGKTLGLQRALAQIRPGAESAGFAEIFSGTPVRKLGRDYAWDANCRIEIDDNGRVSTITYWAGFPTSIEIGDVRIGISKGELAAICPSLKVIRDDPEKRRTFLDHGKTAAGHHLRVFLKEDRAQVIELAAAAKGESPIYRLARSTFDRDLQDKWKTVADPDAMLDIWIQHVDPAHLQRKLVKAYVGWLKAGDPDRWHLAARNWNWDNGTAPLFWIIRQPDCDLATAILIYRMAEPYHYLDPRKDKAPHERGENFGLIVEIRRRVADGRYPRRELRLDATGWFDEPWCRISDDPDFPGVLPGREVADGVFYDGFPAEIYPGR